jgi:peptidoglycan pentaglycine glycine transferase (the first glycine)
MRVTHIGSDRHEEWNALVAQEPSFALLQSWEWGEFKERLGWRAFRIAVEGQGRIVAGAQMLVKPMPLGLVSVAYVPRGPLGDWLNESIALRLLPELHQIARHCRAIFLKIEPPLHHGSGACRVLQQYNFRASHYSNQPRATIIVDLRQNLDNIMGRMRKKTRQYIRYAARNGVTVREGGREDLPAFYDLIRRTAQRGRFSIRVRDYYEHQWQAFADTDQVALLMAIYQGQLLAGRTVFHFGDHAAEFHAGSSDECRHLRPDYLLVWEAIKWAKARGCCTYDLWGIPDEVGRAIYEGEGLPVPERHDGLWGVYQFKRGFSRNVVFYTSAYDYVFSPVLYTLVTNRLLSGDLLDQMATRMDLLRIA